jgi:hypothetical protein
MGNSIALACRARAAPVCRENGIGCAMKVQDFACADAITARAIKD